MRRSGEGGSETESSPLSGLAEMENNISASRAGDLGRIDKLGVGSLQVKLVHNHHRNINGVLILQFAEATVNKINK